MNLSMQSRSFIIASFILVSLLVVGGVEYLCQSLGNALSVEGQSEVAAPAPATIALPVSKPQTAESEGRLKALVPENYAIITKRGLFGKVKLVKVEEKKTDPSPEPLQETRLNLTLMGTISGEGDVQRAIISDKTGKTQDIYYKGDAIGSAIIKEVMRGKVILTVGGKDEILLMEELNSGAVKGANGGAAGKTSTGSAFFTPLPTPKKITEAKRIKPAKGDGKRQKSPGYLSRSVNFQKILNQRKKDK